MGKLHGSRRLGFSRVQWWMFAVGSGYVLAGWYRWPEPLRERVRTLGWNLLLAFVPW